MSWQDAFKKVAREYLNADGEWGESDCCQFISDYWRELHGHDYASRFDYHSQMGAFRIIADHGGDLDGLLAHLLGDPQPPYTGAVCTFDLPEGTGAGVYAGYCIWAIMPEHGLVRFPPNLLRAAW